MNLRLTYLYRDAANYKNFNDIVFANPNNLPLQQVQAFIQANLIDYQWFYAHKWNLPDMHFPDTDTELDLSWHEFNNLQETTEPPNTDATIDDLLNTIASHAN